MKTVKLLMAGFSLSTTISLADHLHAFDLDTLSDTGGVLQQGERILQGGDAATAATSSTGLTEVLMQQLGVTQQQAQGGAGALFQLAESRMSAKDFTALSNSIPDMQSLLGAAPAAGVLGSGGMAGTFLQLGLTPDMVQKFIPTIVQYVEGTGGSALATALRSALMGGMM
ncbi:DUF2780 domain-containing protein [Nitrosomonas halophila]|uniref:DUF2780 domain-containing protein n=1 Tax=Nitrosomonas halophila TaxID=44576 RepID=A0A1H3DL22_9PROT|nr:DUF2780 domain-containing protein [Nitrosomonas halophila]SDX67105.1 Protein of unknown function VcgC/VcgE [Nitrosomonas halophila]